MEKPDYRHRGLLRARRERPRDRRTAEERDELAALHVWMTPAWQEKIERAAQKSLAVMCPACSRSPDGLLALMESANRGLITLFSLTGRWHRQRRPSRSDSSLPAARDRSPRRTDSPGFAARGRRPHRAPDAARPPTAAWSPHPR